MTDADEVSDNNNTNQHVTLIPQIVLTEPPLQNQDNHDSQDKILTTNTLSPPSSSTSTSPINTNPLPLTKDILQRKNKLDKLLFQKERHHQSHSAEYFSSNPVDERVTAGLGISTPNGLKSPTTRNIHHRTDTEKNSQRSEWSYDLDAFKSITTDSSKGKHDKRRHNTNTQSGATSVSGSSNRNSVSMRAYSANHRYMDTNKHNDFKHYQRPEQHNTKQSIKNKSKYHLIELIYQAAVRVINSRAPESKLIKNLDHFNYKQEQHYIPSPPPTPIKISIEQPPVNERIDYITHSNRNSNSHRFSWFSFTNSIEDNKSFYDENESINLEKKLSSIDSTSPLPPPQQSKPIPEIPLQGNSMYIFSPHNPIRIHVWKFIRKR